MTRNPHLPLTPGLSEAEWRNEMREGPWGSPPSPTPRFPLRRLLALAALFWATLLFAAYLMWTRL